MPFPHIKHASDIEKNHQIYIREIVALLYSLFNAVNQERRNGCGYGHTKILTKRGHVNYLFYSLLDVNLVLVVVVLGWLKLSGLN